MFIVEDGTALENANSYVTVQEFRDYWGDRGTDYTAKADEEIESSLVLATQYIDMLFVQALHFLSLMLYLALL